MILNNKIKNIRIYGITYNRSFIIKILTIHAFKNIIFKIQFIYIII